MPAPHPVEERRLVDDVRAARHGGDGRVLRVEEGLPSVTVDLDGHDASTVVPELLQVRVLVLEPAAEQHVEGLVGLLGREPAALGNVELQPRQVRAGERPRQVRRADHECTVELLHVLPSSRCVRLSGRATARRVPAVPDGDRAERAAGRACARRDRSGTCALRAAGHDDNPLRGSVRRRRVAYLKLNFLVLQPPTSQRPSLLLIQYWILLVMRWSLPSTEEWTRVTMSTTTRT